MLIKEACKECFLTKKAIEYYERQGLVSPEVDQNGYRNFSHKDISALKEISVLRRLGLSIDDIKDILSSFNKSAALVKYKYLLDLKLEKSVMQQNCLQNLIENYDINEGIKYIDSHINRLFTIKEKLVQSFPGTYGMYLSVHFGQFLNERVDSKEKEVAYSEIVNFLDAISVNITAEIEEYLENYFILTETADMEKIDNNLVNAIEDINNYITNNRESLEAYIKIRTSEEFKSSPAYRFQQLLLDFQKSTGYYEIFISNLKILSSSYRKYTDKLEEANKVFIEKYPQLANLF